MIGSARGIRIASLVGALAVLALARALVPDPGTRSEVLYAVVIVVGYGHLLGAMPSRPRRGRRGTPARVLSIATAFCGYTAMLRTLPELVPVLLVVSIWHTAENDVALGRTLALGGRPARLPRGLRAHGLAAAGSALMIALFADAGAGDLVAARLERTASAPLRWGPAPGATFAAVSDLARVAAAAMAIVVAVAAPVRSGGAAALAAAAALLPDPAAWLSFPEAFALFGLYHLLCWIGVSLGRGRRWRLARVHALPAVACAALLVVPGDGAAQLRSLFFSPEIYLFWSALHVGQTLHARARGGA